jgi:hypothetical protein
MRTGRWDVVVVLEAEYREALAKAEAKAEAALAKAKVEAWEKILEDPATLRGLAQAEVYSELLGEESPLRFLRSSLGS